MVTLRSDDSDTVDSVSGSDNTAAIIGGVVAVVLVIAVTIITISCISLILRNRRAEFELRQLRFATKIIGDTFNLLVSINLTEVHMIRQEEWY